MKNDRRIRNKLSVRDLVLDGCLIAIVFVSTYLIQFRLPFASQGGLVHAGNIALFTIAMLFGSRRGAVSGAFGMAIFDLMSGWALWAPFTFVIRGVMGWIIGRLSSSEQMNATKFGIWHTLVIAISGVWMIIGYYITEVVLYGNYIVPLNSIFGNISQIVIGVAGAIPLAYTLKHAMKFYLKNNLKA